MDGSSSTVWLKVLNRRSFDNKISVLDDKQLKKTSIVVDKGLRHTGRIDVFQAVFIEYNGHLRRGE